MHTDPATDGPSDHELAKQLYDMLMREIEPDLVSYNLEKLDEYYQEESAEEKKNRMERYQRAYEEFDVAFDAFVNKVHDEVRTTKHDSLEAKEAADKATEADDVAALEDKLSSLE